LSLEVEKKTLKKWTILDLYLCFMMLFIFAYVYAGFFFPDPRMQKKLCLIVWIIRFLFPLMAGGLLYFFYCVRTKRIHIVNIALIGVSVVICLLLGYPVASYVHDAHFFTKQTKLYHPYLQLSPQDYKQRESDQSNQSLKIFCLGGSTTEFTDSQGRDWPSRVEKLLQQAFPGRTIDVHNFGRQWYTSLHLLINYETNLRQHKPDIIIVMEAINDLLHNADFSYFSFGIFQEDYGHFYGPVYRLINRTTVLQTLYTLFRSMWYHKTREIINTDVFPGIVPFETNLRTLIDLAHKDGTTVIVMTQPNLYKDSMTDNEMASLTMLNFEAVGPTKQWSFDTAKTGMMQYNNAIKNISLKTGVFLIDLESVIHKSLDYFYDDVHYKNRTFDIIAEHITKRFQELSIIGD